MAQVWLNGRFLDDSQASVSVRDSGLLHAAGVFTTLRAYQGRPFRLSDHLRRLRESCEALFVPLQYKDDALANVAVELLARNGLADARMRLTVTRGIVHQDPLHGQHMEPTVLFTAAAFEAYPQEYYRRGMTVVLLDQQKLNPYDLQAGHKTLNYFSRLVGLKDAVQRGAGEALWFNVHNYLQSASVANVFMVKDRALLTPPTADELREKALADAVPYPRSSVLPGVTRKAVIELARAAGIPVKLAAIDVNLLLDADELLLTNSVMGIMPVCRIERRVIGGDRPGLVTQRLAADYAELVRRECE